MKRFMVLTLMSVLPFGNSFAADVESPISLVNSNVGHLSVTSGLNAVRDLEDGQSNDENVAFLDVDGSFSLAVSDDMSLIVDGMFRKDFFGGSQFDLSAGPDDVESLDWQFMVGGHWLANVGEASRVGVMGGYGDSSNAENESYSLMILGVEGQTFIDSNLMVYAQAGWGDQISGDQSDQGFQNGVFGRIGVTYFVADHTALNMDIEHARVAEYIDGSDAGRFTSVALNGETVLPFEEAPLSILYRAGFNNLDATTEGDKAKEWEVGLGLKFAFGVTSPREAALAGGSLGMPSLPIRASHYTSTLD